MKYQSSNTKHIYDLDFPKPGRYRCPECADGSKRKNPKDVQFYDGSDRAFCHKCEATLYPYKPYEKKKEYTIPDRKNSTKLSDKALKYWEGRMISQTTLNSLGMYSDTQPMPTLGNVEVMCFPFFRDGELVNIKYRGPHKTFKLVSNAELIWYNFDALKDTDEIIICEGEGEVLSWWENGYHNAISVPNGAGSGSEYLDNSIALFDQIKTIYLATDNDTKGIELRDDLARRIGAEKCSVISFRECKDGNEYFCKHGGLEFKELLKQARPIPVKGIVKVDAFRSDIIDLRENGIQKGATIEQKEIDKYATWELGRLAVVTGVPGSGKSEFVDHVSVKLNLINGWKAAYFTPENYPLKFHYAKLHEKIAGIKFQSDSESSFWTVYEHIRENFFYILNEEDFTVDAVLEAAKSLIRQYGVKVLVLDPYNRFEHAQKTGESETQYISKFLDRVTMFAKIYNVLIFLVAHPRKMIKGDIPNMYDIAGSANFYNKADYGITVHRERNNDGLMTNEIEIYWQKIKFRHLGDQGVSEMRYNYTNGRFEDRVSVDQWDNSCWLTVKPINYDIRDFSEPEKESEEILNGTIDDKPAPF